MAGNGGLITLSHQPNMKSKPTVCIPWRPTIDRIGPFTRVVNEFKSRGFEIVVADSNPNLPFNLSEARNKAVRKTKSDRVIVCDADTLPDFNVLNEAIEFSGASLQLPYNDVRFVAPQLAFEQNLKAVPFIRIEEESVGGVCVIDRDSFEEIAGWDESFTEWGYEDNAFYYAADTIVGVKRHVGDLINFKNKRKRDISDANNGKHLAEIYKMASGNRSLMLSLVSARRDAAYRKKGYNGRYAIAITTRNRRDVFYETYNRIKELNPGIKIIVVDDASYQAIEVADFRFKKNVGVAKAKNKCLELLMETDADHFFLFDDDTYPIEAGWQDAYINHTQDHLMYLRDTFHTDGTGIPNGCMLYVHRRVVEKVGGMDVTFGRYGWEHVSWSDRIFNYGLTEVAYLDAYYPNRVIKNLNENDGVKTVIGTDSDEFKYHLGRGVQLLQQSKESTYFVNYKDEKTAILTCAYNGKPDPQRGVSVTEYDMGIAIEPLIKSCPSENVIIFTNLDSHDDGVVTVIQNNSPYFQRWLDYRHWLEDHPEIEKVWMVDAFDVIKLRDCWTMNDDVLYVGSENRQVGFRWMKDNHPEVREWINDNHQLQLLNAGIVGGKREYVLKLLNDIVTEYKNSIKRNQPVPWSDMGIFNKVIHSKYKFTTGLTVHTEYKRYDKTHPTAIWAHK